MHKLTVLAAALAAGVISFASGSAYAQSSSFRVQEETTIQAGHASKPKAAAASKPSRKSASQVSARKAVEAKTTTRRKAKRSKVVIDTTTTASIPKADKAAVTSGSAAPYSAIIARYASDYGVPVSLAKAVIKIESNYRPHLTGRAGEVGLMQIKPATARMLGYSGSVKGLYDPDTNIKYGMKYLAMAQNLGGGTTCGTILKYNAGHGAKRMNPVSSAYCSKVKVQMASAGAEA